jgi:hypothetical protein
MARGCDLRGRDLGGWYEHAGEIEVARLIVGERDIALVSADRGTLLEIATHPDAERYLAIGPLSTECDCPNGQPGRVASMRSRSAFATCPMTIGAELRRAMRSPHRW